MPTDELDRAIRSLLARQVERAPHATYDDVLERHAVRAGDARRRRRLISAGALAVTVAAVAAVFAWRDPGQTVVAGGPPDGQATADGPFDPADWELTSILDDGRIARLDVGEGLCVTIEAADTVCEAGLDAEFGWFAVSTGTSDLVAYQYLQDPVRIVYADGTELIETGEFGPGALYRGLVEIPGDAGPYEIARSPRDVLLEQRYDGGPISEAQLFVAPTGHLCVEVRASESRSSTCVAMSAAVDDEIETFETSLSGQPLLFGTAPAATDLISIDDPSGSGTGAHIAAHDDRVVWLGDTAVMFLEPTLTITAFELVDDGDGDPADRLLDTATHRIDPAAPDFPSGAPTRTEAPAPTTAGDSTTFRDPVAGLQITHPASWNRTTDDLTPDAGLTFRLALSTGAITPGGGEGCGHLPVAALDGLGADDVLIHLEERAPAATSTAGIVGRPERFLDELEGVDTGTDAWACLASNQRDDIGILRWITFRDSGRDFALLVAIGNHTATVDTVADVLDSFTVTAPLRD